MPIDGQPAVRSCIPEMKQLGGTPGAGGGFVTVRWVVGSSRMSPPRHRDHAILWDSIYGDIDRASAVHREGL